LDKRLEAVVRGVFPIDAAAIDENWTSDDIPAWDSVGHLNLIVEIEKRFAVKIEVEEMFEIVRLGDIARLLQRKGAL
jgi:acyl carrier protein